MHLCAINKLYDSGASPSQQMITEMAQPIDFLDNPPPSFFSASVFSRIKYSIL